MCVGARVEEVWALEDSVACGPAEPEMLDCIFAGLLGEDAPAVHVLDPDLENDGIGFGFFDAPAGPLGLGAVESVVAEG